MYESFELILGLNEAVRARNEEACRELLRHLRTRYEKPETEMRTILQAMGAEDVDWLKQIIISGSAD